MAITFVSAQATTSSGNATATLTADAPAVPAGGTLWAVVEYGTTSPTGTTAGTITPAEGGWTSHGVYLGQNTSAGVQFGLFSRYSDNAQSATTYTFTGSNVGSYRTNVMFAAYTGVDPTEPVLLVGASKAIAFGYLSGGSVTRTTPSLTTDEAAWLVGVWGDRAGSNYSGHSDGMVERFDMTAPVTNTSLSWADSNTTVVAGSYTRTATATVSSSSGAQLLFAMKPRPESTGPTLPAVANLRIGTWSVPAMYLGTTTVTKAYLGTVLVYGEGSDGTSTVDPFILGTTEPTRDNTGVMASGAAAPTVPINGNVTVASGETLRDRVINGYVTLTDSTSVLENCIVRGPATHSGNTPLVKTANITSGMGKVRFCDIVPQTPSAYVNGFDTSHYHAYRCYVARVTDAFRGYMPGTGATAKAQILIEGCFVANMTRFAPDYATNNRTETHNDLFQLENNAGGDVNDIIYRGNAGYIVPDPSAGQTTTTLTQYHGIMLSQNVTGGTINATFDRNWFYGGILPFHGSGFSGSGSLVITGNRFQKKNETTPASISTVYLSAAAQANLTYSGNVYMSDNTAVPIQTA